MCHETNKSILQDSVVFCRAVLFFMHKRERRAANIFLYYWNMSGQIRTAIDRLFALEDGDGNLLRGHNRACELLMAAEGNAFEDVLTYFDHLMQHLQWENLGHVLAGGNGAVGDIQGKQELQKAYELGKSIQ